MDNTNWYDKYVNNIKSINLTKEIIKKIRYAIGDFWDENIYDSFSDGQKYKIEKLKENIDDEMALSKDDINTICWLLDRYGQKDILIKFINSNTEKVTTYYEKID